MTQETKYYITFEGNEERTRVEEEVYPLMELGQLYLKFVALREDGTRYGYIIVRPDQIVRRFETHTEERYEELQDASREAKQMAADRAEYEAAEREHAMANPVPACSATPEKKGEDEKDPALEYYISEEDYHLDDPNYG